MRRIQGRVGEEQGWSSTAYRLHIVQWRVTRSSDRQVAPVGQYVVSLRMYKRHDANVMNLRSVRQHTRTYVQIRQSVLSAVRESFASHSFLVDRGVACV
jgi:hypothetical protein